VSKTIAEYAASPIVNAYAKLQEEFREAKAAQTKVPEESSKIDNGKPSGKAYLVLAGVVVTLLAPLKIIGCSVSLLSNYAYLPVTIIVVGLLRLLRKIGWTERGSMVEGCIAFVALWPLFISVQMAELTTAETMEESTIYLHRLHLLQEALLVLSFEGDSR
jgi:hypothetical protein